MSKMTEENNVRDKSRINRVMSIIFLARVCVR